MVYLKQIEQAEFVFESNKKTAKERRAQRKVREGDRGTAKEETDVEYKNGTKLQMNRPHK